MSPYPNIEVSNDEPLYNIGVVSRMTGISMATLRAWERRYDFPKSQRSLGGHRLYSERDVIRLHWVKDRIDEGLQTAQAIQALHRQEHSGNLVLIERFPTPRVEKPSEEPLHLKYYENQVFAALLNRDHQTADSLLGEALALSSPEDLILDVISPTLRRFGETWEEGQINIAAEHFATNYLRQRLLMWMVSGPPPRVSNPVVLACAPEEWHEGSLLVLGALLRRRRWPVAYLGQAVPLPDLSEFVKDLNPPLVILVAFTETSATHLVDWPHWLPEAAQSGRPIIGYGGRIFQIKPEWRIRMAGYYLGDNLKEGISNIDRMLQRVY